MSDDFDVTVLDDIPDVATLVRRVKELEEAMRALYNDAGVDDIDPRLDYVMVQVGRDEWNNFVAVVKP